MPQHVLECECGNHIPVSTSQAGASVVCPTCSKTIVIPSLRELKSRPLYETKPSSRWAFLPERSLPKSPAAIGIGIALIVVAVITPLLIAAGVFEASTNPRAAFFRLENFSLWGGLVVLILSGAVSVLRGLGYPVAGPGRQH